MEEHRLTTMKEGYDEKLFNDLYEKVKPLKRKLASTISTSKLGISYDDILSWFDIKFIFVFNKYFENKEPEVLKGFIIITPFLPVTTLLLSGVISMPRIHLVVPAFR